MTVTAVLWLAFFAVAAFANWISVETGQKVGEYVTKPLAMALLLGVAAAIDPADDTARWFVLGAVVFSLVGDVFLMLPGDRSVPGLAAFLVAHLLYVAGFIARGIDAPRLAFGLVLVALTDVTVGRRIIAGATQRDPALAQPVTAYVGVISLMVVTALGTGLLRASLGALAFYLSDALIGWTRFVGPLPRQRLAIMSTYHAGQLFLVLALV